MATTPRIFSLDYNRGKVFGSTTVATPYEWRKFKVGDTERLRVYLVEADPAAGEGRLATLLTTGLTLKVALGSVTGGTSYTSVTLTPDDTGSYFEGDLPLNVAGISNLFSASKADRSANIEFQLTDGGYDQSIDFDVTIRYEIISTSLTDTAPPDTAIGTQQAIGMFVPQANSSTPFQMIVKDSDGSGRVYVWRIYGGTPELTQIS